MVSKSRLVGREMGHGHWLELGKALEKPGTNLLVFFQRIGAGSVGEVALGGDQRSSIGKDTLLAIGIFIQGDGMEAARCFAAFG